MTSRALSPMQDPRWGRNDPTLWQAAGMISAVPQLESGCRGWVVRRARARQDPAAKLVGGWGLDSCMRSWGSTTGWTAWLPMGGNQGQIPRRRHSAAASRPYGQAGDSTGTYRLLLDVHHLPSLHCASNSKLPIAVCAISPVGKTRGDRSMPSRPGMTGSSFSPVSRL